MSLPAWFNGELRPLEDCTVSVRTHALHYGSSVFEGIRAYKTPDGTQVFRLTDHLKRLFWSASLYRIPVPYTLDELHAACRATVRACDLESAYIRPLVMRGDCGLGVIPGDMNTVDVAILAQDWGTFLGIDSIEKGITACVTSWQRPAPNTIPSGAKAGGNYLSSQLVGLEARERGYQEGIALGTDGLLSEGTGENVFVVRNGVLYTPPASSSILSGITRDTVMRLAQELLDLPVREQALGREELYTADEVFFTGTAVEVTPVRKIDHLPIGEGGRGPITERVQEAFFGLFNGRTSDRWGWLEPLGD